MPEQPSIVRGEEQDRRSIGFLPPLGQELFYVGMASESTLPAEIRANPQFQEQAAQRRELHSLFDRVFDAVPDPLIDIHNALHEGLIEQGTVSTLWNKTAEFIEQDELNTRLLLYLPSEILPNFRTQTYKDAPLQSAAQRFADVARYGWIRLLHEPEPRANFIDGDILEPGLDEPEKISKAGHLTPDLLEKGIISQHDVLVLLDIMQEKTLLRSLAEGTVVARDRGLLDDDAGKKANEIIEAKLGMMQRTPKEELYYNNPDSDRISKGRAKWLRKVHQEAKDDQEAAQLAQLILVEGDIIATVQGSVATLALFKAGESMHQQDPVQARVMAVKSLPHIKQIWDSGDSTTHDAIVSGLHHWTRVGMIEQEVLQQFNITMVDASAPSQYDEEAFSKEFGYLQRAAQKIAKHEVLSQALYPEFLVFGSRVKGYADIGSDLDAAVFFRSNTPFEQREHILDLLRQDVPELSTTDTLVEFWTREEDGKLRFVMPEEDTRIFVGEDQIHFVMGGVWTGESGELRKIRDEMLRHYLDTSHFEDQKRAQYVGQLEQDVLQCRLLHKGYRKLYPHNKPEAPAHAGLIDWESDYWDSGYRRVATKLFVSRVFLPTRA